MPSMNRRGNRAVNVIRYQLAKFLTDNGLFRVWKGETSAFSISGWRGRRDRSFPEQGVKTVLDAFFSPDRDTWFAPFYTRDYKYTYLGKGLFPDGGVLYLKYYAVNQAPRKIRSRNILRRALAKKAMSLYYILKEKGISSVRPVFYARRERLWVPREAVFVSVSAEANETLVQVLPRLLGGSEASALVTSLGGYAAMLHRNGVLYGELSRNLIPVKKDGTWSFILCDLDEMRSVGGVTEEDGEKYLAPLRRDLEKLGSSLADAFRNAYRNAREA